MMALALLKTRPTLALIRNWESAVPKSESRYVGAIGLMARIAGFTFLLYLEKSCKWSVFSPSRWQRANVYGVEATCRTPASG